MKSNVVLLLTNSAMTGTTVVTSSPIRLDQIYGFAVQAFWVGSPNVTGTFKLQASCDSPPTHSQVSNGGPDAVTNWDDITNSPHTITTDTGGTYTWNFNGAFYNYVRLVYTNASGSGSLSAEICLKG